ncbi:hypothetical protein KI387_042941 [Taxus chinensis]|uniref:Uncharacterized protein n=1 Tax=Taxus chinensis TaxID=29808 RepID=A0AA38C6H4_TAXCH|nr:hypothetical protein KI387_042941 [Taxus chinensis]
MEQPKMYAMLLTLAVLVGYAGCLGEFTSHGPVHSFPPSPFYSLKDTAIPTPSHPSPIDEPIEGAAPPTPPPSPSPTQEQTPTPPPSSSPNQGITPTPPPSPLEDNSTTTPTPPSSPSPSSPSGVRSPKRAPRDPAAHDFCSRAAVTKSCPTPPTRNEFNVDEYLGRWYEVGATAQFKFEYEAGVICERAQHSLIVDNNENYGAVVALLNRGQPVLKPFQASAVTRLSATAHGVCNHAHAICDIVDDQSPLYAALDKLVSTVHSIRNDSVMRYRHELSSLSPATRELQYLRRNITVTVDRLARGMTRLQHINGNISQGVGHADANVDALMDLSSDLKDTVAVLNLRIADVAPNVRADVLRDAAQLADVSTLLSAVTASARAYDTTAPPYSWNPVQYPVAETRGVAVQNPDAAGKFDVHQYGHTAPYWVLDVDVADDGANGTDIVPGSSGAAVNGTSYNAALIYSCTEEKDGPPQENLFLLARNASLSDDTITRFQNTAAQYEPNFYRLR